MVFRDNLSWVCNYHCRYRFERQRRICTDYTQSFRPRVNQPISRNYSYPVAMRENDKDVPNTLQRSSDWHPVQYSQSWSGYSLLASDFETWPRTLRRNGNSRLVILNASSRLIICRQKIWFLDPVDLSDRWNLGDDVEKNKTSNFVSRFETFQVLVPRDSSPSRLFLLRRWARDVHRCYLWSVLSKVHIEI
jgi:hypothetical protein